MIVRWTDEALADLQRIQAYVAEHRPDAAAQLVQGLVRAAGLLAEHPKLGHSGRRPGTREFSRRPYKIIYEIGIDAVYILHLVHSAQDWR